MTDPEQPAETTVAQPAEITLRTPNEESLGIARLIKNRMGKRTQAPVRVSFIGSYDSQRKPGEVPPMARILRGGRGGEVRLKLELSFLWFAVNPPHDLTYPARAWATLIGLEDAEGRGTRRVRQATSALAAADLISVVANPGQPNKIFLLDEGAEAQKYVLPGEAYNKSRGSGQEWRNRYVQIPDTFWTNGWITSLSGAGVAMLLVLFAELGQKDPAKSDLWFSPSAAKKIYGLSEDTRSKGLRELRRAGLITARKKAASRDVLDFRRLRNTYRIQIEAFEKMAAVPSADAPTPQPVGPGQIAFEEQLKAWAKAFKETGGEQQR